MVVLDLGAHKQQAAVGAKLTRDQVSPVPLSPVS